MSTVVEAVAPPPRLDSGGAGVRKQVQEPPASGQLADLVRRLQAMVQRNNTPCPR